MKDNAGIGALAARLGRAADRLRAWRGYRSARTDRLRDHELALINIKTLGYELARLLTAARLGGPPPDAPQIVGLKSKPCTQADIEGPWLRFWCAEAGIEPAYDRKLWECCYVVQALHEMRMLEPDRTGLGFGCGREPLPSFLAKRGCSVLATNLAPSDAAARRWVESGEHAADIETVRDPSICPDPERLAQIGFRYLDMRDIPRDLDGAFDFCWSCCAAEHLGSIARGLDFVERSLRVLRPGGVAVHTLELSLTGGGKTLDAGDTVLFRPRDIEALAERLSRQGHRVAELDFDAGDGILDRFFDQPPWDLDLHRRSLPRFHLKVSVYGYPSTSFGLIVRRAG